MCRKLHDDIVACDYDEQGLLGKSSTNIWVNNDIIS